MTRKNKSRAGGHTSTAATVTRKNVRHPHYSTEQGRGTSDIPYRNASGSIVARQRHDTVYKRIYSSRGHMFGKPPAIGSDVAILEEAQRNGARFFEVEDADTGKVYRALIGDFWRYGHPRNHGSFGAQRALPLTHWQVRRSGEPVAEQLTLFGGEA